MPLVHSENMTEECHLMVWRLSETEEELRIGLPSPIDEIELSSISHPQKKREWMAGRLLLSHLVNESGHRFRGIRKDEHGKPFLIDCSCYISLTHTAEYVGAVLHTHQPIGIDMERKHDKLVRTAARYLNERERAHAGEELSCLCIYWCAKEALYKLNGRKKVSFREDIALDYFNPETLNAMGTLHEQGFLPIRANLHIRWIEEYCLVVAI